MDDIEDVMYELDANGDGQISKAEFRLLMENVVELLDKDVSGARLMGMSSSNPDDPPSVI